ncbi:MAG: DUF2029 domain-containing protein [Planctomycetes bacterium]|nr:DUF2029 domain-containing protein [Planctomycetota bacterium]
MSEPEPPPIHSRLETAGVLLYVVMAASVAVRLALESDLARQNVWFKVFAPAARAFADGAPMYAEASGFRYPPLAAAAMVPFTWLGPLAGSVVWRWSMLLFLALAVRACFRAGFPFAPTSRERGVFWLLTTLGVVGSANIGQPNTLVLGCLLFAALAAWRGRNTTAASCVVAATAIKVYPLSLGLVLAVLRPRMWLPLGLGVAAIVGLPFLLQEHGYVAAQYEALFDLLRAEDRTGLPENAYRDLRSLAAACGVPIGRTTFTLLQVATGGAIALLCHRLRRRGLAAERVFEYALGLTICWCLLLGPATERVTYALLGPSIGWGMLAAWRRVSRGDRVAWTALVISYLADHFIPSLNRAWQHEHPWTRQNLVATALCATLLLVHRALRDGWNVGPEGATMAGRGAP